MHIRAAIAQVEITLRRRYLDLCRRLGVVLPTTRRLDCYLGLERRYGEAGRHYHTLTHIAHCVLEFDSVIGHAKEPDDILAAIFYHDALYDPRARDNEEQSGRFWTEVARSALHIKDERRITEVERFILLSKRHRADPLRDPDAALFLDIDMSILGADASMYDAYAKAIREEYRDTYGDKEFAMRRANWLTTTLDNPPIFLTEVFRKKYEERARANLKEELFQIQSA